MEKVKLGEKLDGKETIFKRLVEQLKFNRIVESEWYGEKTPACVCFSVKNTNYSIYYNDKGEYIVVSNFQGGCSISREQSKPMDLDSLFTMFDDKYDDMVRKTMKFIPPI